MGWRRPRCGSVGARANIATAAVLLSAVAMMVKDLDTPIHGSFYFRQAHIAANIEQFASNGPSLVPATYNLDMPYAVFDFPLYQLLVAAICGTLGSDALSTARVVNVVIFGLTVLLVDRLLALGGMRRFHRLGAVFLFCFSPMNLFYCQSPFVDPLAIGLSLLSLYVFIGLESTESPRRLLLLAILLATGVLSTLIKSPIYLPVFVAVVVDAMWRRFLPMSFRELLVYVAVIGGTVLGFKTWSNRVNGVSGLFDANELRDYFGPWSDRFDPESWHRIGGVLHHDAANALTAALALLGVALWALRSRSRCKALFLGLVLGWSLTLLVFFNRFTWHNYYLLGFEFPLAFFGAYALDRARVLSRAWRRREGARIGLPVTAAFVVVAAYTVLASTIAMQDLAATPTEWIRVSGEFIRRSTAPDDFVVYLVESQDFRDWNPVFLYFAQRRGYNVTTRRLERHPTILSRLEARYGSSSGHLLVFCPARAAPRLAPLIESQGARLVDAGPSGWLYRMNRGQAAAASVLESPNRDHRAGSLHAPRPLIWEVERVELLVEPWRLSVSKRRETSEERRGAETFRQALVDPRVLDNVVARYLDCGVAEGGFVRIVCEDCRSEFLLCFSCKARSLCPSCDAKRASAFAGFL